METHILNKKSNIFVALKTYNAKMVLERESELIFKIQSEGIHIK